MGGVDAASWKLREALVALAEERLNAMTRRPEEKLIADLVTLEVECRFPALSDAFQTLLERFERDWGYRKSFAADLALTGTPISSGVVYALQREPGWSAARLGGGAPSAGVSRDDSRALRVPDHIAVRLYQDQPLVELTAWRPAESDHSVSARTWFALQDRARLVPFDSALAGPELIDQVFLSALVDIVVGAIQWREILIARFRSVFTARYQREGMGTPHWRDEAVAREHGGLKRASGGEMVVKIRLPEVFAEWTRTLGYEVTRDGEGLVLANAGGELRYYFVPDPAGVALLRAERAEGPTPVMTAADIDDLVRFLITVLGYDLRATRGLPAIRLPFDWSSPAPGLTPVDLGAGWTGLRTDDDRVVDVAMIDRDVAHPIVMFSHVASAPVIQLIASYEDRDGAPLLSEFVR